MSHDKIKQVESSPGAEGHVQPVVIALQAIAELQPRPFEDFPTDWSEQVERCSECQRYKDHPIQQGICDKHRKPLWAREAHLEHEKKALGIRMRQIAKDALAAL